jgi:hypothetical protein
VLQGFTSNFGDELVGLLPEFLGGGDAGKEEMRLRGDFMRREHPVGDVASQAAGAVGAAVTLPIGGAMKGASLAQKALQGGRVGAVFGGLQGAGSGEDMESRLIGGAAGTVAGGIIGHAVPYAMASRPVQAITRPIGNAVRGMLTPGAAAAEATAVVTPLEQSYAKLGAVRSQLDQAIDDMGGFTKARAANDRLLNGGRGEEARLVDLGRPMTQLADLAATNSPRANAALSDIVEQRGEASTARVLNDFKAAAGDHHAPSRQAQLAAETKAWADGPDAYGGIRAANPNVPLGDAEKLVTQPRIKNMMAEAKRTGQIGPEPEDMASRAMAEARAENAELDAFLKANPKLDVEALLADPDVEAQLSMLGKSHLLEALRKVGGNTFDNVQDLHSALRDAANSAFVKGANSLGFRLKASAAVVNKTLEDAIPGYADIVDQYAARKGLETASKLGEEWFGKKADVTGLNNVVASLADKPALLEEFRRGLASKQIIALQSQSGTNQATKTMIAKNNLAQQNMNKIVFGDEATYDKFMQQAAAERQLHKLAEATGGSQTSGREAAKQRALGTVGAFLDAPTLKSGLYNSVRKAVRGKALEKNADELLPFLTTKGHDEVARLLDLLERTSPRAAMGIGTTNATPSAITSLFGSTR